MGAQFDTDGEVACTQDYTKQRERHSPKQELLIPEPATNGFGDSVSVATTVDGLWNAVNNCRIFFDFNLVRFTRRISPQLLESRRNVGTHRKLAHR